MFFATRDASHAGRGDGAAGGRTTQQVTRADPGLFGAPWGHFGVPWGYFGVYGGRFGVSVDLLG